MAAREKKCSVLRDEAVCGRHFVCRRVLKSAAGNHSFIVRAIESMPVCQYESEVVGTIAGGRSNWWNETILHTYNHNKCVLNSESKSLMENEDKNSHRKLTLYKLYIIGRFA